VKNIDLGINQCVSKTALVWKKIVNNAIKKAQSISKKYCRENNWKIGVF